MSEVISVLIFLILFYRLTRLLRGTRIFEIFIERKFETWMNMVTSLFAIPNINPLVCNLHTLILIVSSVYIMTVIQQLSMCVRSLCWDPVLETFFCVLSSIYFCTHTNISNILQKKIHSVTVFYKVVPKSSICLLVPSSKIFKNYFRQTAENYFLIG